MHPKDDLTGFIVAFRVQMLVSLWLTIIKITCEIQRVLFSGGQSLTK